MKQYSLLLFDWDGCIVNTLTIYLKAYKMTFAHFGLYPTEEEIIKKVFGSWHAPTLLGVKNLEEFNRLLVINADKFMDSITLNPYVKETLEQFQNKGKKMAILTSSKRNTISIGLEKTGISKFFDLIITVDDVKEYKPNPEGVLTALKYFKQVPDKTVLIGDSKSDLGAAKNAGVDAILYVSKENKNFYGLEEYVSFSPTFTIEEFRQLHAIIE